MLLGSFQEIPNDNKGKIVKIGEVPSHFNEELGFRPVWCFPMDDFESAVFHALTVAPNMPHMFCVFDTDEYYRIDRVKHYQNVLSDKSDDKAIAGCINGDLDNFHSEIIIDRNIAEKSMIFSMPLNQFVHVGHGIHFNEMVGSPPDVFKNAPSDADTIIAEVLGRIPCMKLENTIPEDGGFGSIPINEKTFELYAMHTDYMKRFSLTLFPALYHLLHDGRTLMIWVKCMIPCLSQVMKLCFQDFPKWANEDCSSGKYDEMIESFKKYLITNEDVLDAYCRNKLPQRNDKCLCGSGKRFKKCCGKYF